jgi:hypothetical protein
MKTKTKEKKTNRKVIHHEFHQDSLTICFYNQVEQKAFLDVKKKVHMKEQLSLDRHQVLMLKKKHQPIV